MKKLLLLLLTIFLFSCEEEIQNIGDIPMTEGIYEYQSEPLMPGEIDYLSYTGRMPDYYGFIVDLADGDTFYVDWFTEDKMGVRVKGIDTPETVDRRKPVQFWGPEASAYAKENLSVGTLVRLSFEGEITGPFGRLLAYVWYWNGEEWVNWQEEMLKTGNAFLYHDYEFEYPDLYLEWQQYAMENRLGMWSEPELIENEIVRTREEFAEEASWYRRRYY